MREGVSRTRGRGSASCGQAGRPCGKPGRLGDRLGPRRRRRRIHRLAPERGSRDPIRRSCEPDTAVDLLPEDSAKPALGALDASTVPSTQLPARSIEIEGQDGTSRTDWKTPFGACRAPRCISVMLRSARASQFEDSPLQVERIARLIDPARATPAARLARRSASTARTRRGPTRFRHGPRLSATPGPGPAALLAPEPPSLAVVRDRIDSRWTSSTRLGALRELGGDEVEQHTHPRQSLACRQR
jgi:hypothetical protein